MLRGDDRGPGAWFVFVVLAVSGAVLGGGEATTEFVLFIVTAFTAAAYSHRPVVGAFAALGAGTVHEVQDPQVHGFGDAVWALGMLTVAWLLGLAVRARQQRIGALESEAASAERRHAEQVAAATAAERTAIARELHDVVAHAVSVIVIQAQAGARALPRDPDLAARVLEQIESSGRTALTELRGLLTLLAADEVSADRRPAASLEQLDELVAGVRAAGLTVDLDIERPLPVLSAIADLAAYRLIQEALTNTLRHAPGSAALVRVRRARGQLEILAQDDGPAVGAAPAATGSGRGLIGMAERIALAGGHLLQAEPTVAGFRVHALVPLADAPASTAAEVGT